MRSMSRSIKTILITTTAIALATVIALAGVRFRAMEYSMEAYSIHCARNPGEHLAGTPVWYVTNVWTTLFGEGVLSLRIMVAVSVLLASAIGALYFYRSTGRIAAAASLFVLAVTGAAAGAQFSFNWLSASYPVLALTTIALIEWGRRGGVLRAVAALTGVIISGWCLSAPFAEITSEALTGNLRETLVDYASVSFEQNMYWAPCTLAIIGALLCARVYPDYRKWTIILCGTIILLFSMFIGHEMMSQYYLERNMRGALHPLALTLLLLAPLRNLFMANSPKEKIHVPSAALWLVGIFLLLIPTGAPAPEALGMAPVYFAIAPITGLLWCISTPGMKRFIRLSLMFSAICVGGIWSVRIAWLNKNNSTPLDDIPMHAGMMSHPWEYHSLRVQIDSATVYSSRGEHFLVPRGHNRLRVMPGIQLNGKEDFTLVHPSLIRNPSQYEPVMLPGLERAHAVIIEGNDGLQPFVVECLMTHYGFTCNTNLRQSAVWVRGEQTSYSGH